MLTTEEVKHIATLARIGLTDEEVARYQRDLSAVIDWFEELRDVDLRAAPLETSMAPESNRAALDVAHDPAEASAILANAPDQKDGLFKVRSVF